MIDFRTLCSESVLGQASSKQQMKKIIQYNKNYLGSNIYKEKHKQPIEFRTKPMNRNLAQNQKILIAIKDRKINSILQATRKYKLKQLKTFTSIMATVEIRFFSSPRAICHCLKTEKTKEKQKTIISNLNLER